MAPIAPNQTTSMAPVTQTATMTSLDEVYKYVTFAYYGCTFFLAFATFIIGTIYLRHRDRKDKKRKEARDQADQQIREELQQQREARDRTYRQIREWRRFAETITSEYRKLKTGQQGNIPRKISKVKNTFENIQLNLEINGLGVLRYMLDDDDENFKTDKLERLRDDLDSIFQLLNTCASLLLLGPIPANIKVELRKIVTQLGELTLPFYKGEDRETILKCLEHFSNRDEIESRVNIDEKLAQDIPYVKWLRFGGNEGKETSQDETRSDYSKCSGFHLLGDKSLMYKGYNTPQELLLLKLHKLHSLLVEARITKDFAAVLQKRKLKLLHIEQINTKDDNELALVKVLHEVRVYIYCVNKGNLNNEQMSSNIKILQDLCHLTELVIIDALVKRTCEKFQDDLHMLMTKPQRYHQNQRFRTKLDKLYEVFQGLLIPRENDQSQPPELLKHVSESTV